MRKIASVFAGLGLAAFASLSEVPAVRAADGDGTIKGQIVWAGDAKTAAKLNVDKDQPHCLSKGDILSEEFVINKDNKGLANVFVYLTTTDGGKPPVPASMAKPEKPTVEIDQPVCAFVPHALGMREGQVLVVKNSAPVAHNVSYAGSRAKNPGGNVIVPAGGKYEVKGLKADKQQLAVACNIHGWMKGWVRVFDHPYFAVTDANGNFEIKNAPKGDFNIVIWHESGYNGGAAGKDGKKITVKPGDNDLGKIDFKN